MQRIAVVDFGTGNLHSVSKAIEHVAGDDEVIVTQSVDIIESADRVVLPGQGAIGSWIRTMRELELTECITSVLGEKPVLGICLGLQAILDFSEEDNGVRGLGVIPGKVRRFVKTENYADCKIPHMGWNNVNQCIDHPIWQGIAQSTRFYFVHSYYADPDNKSDVAGTTDYMGEFCSAVARDNVFAVQFHPEKSHHQGLTLLSNFLHWSAR